MFFPWPGYYEIVLHVCLSGARITKQGKTGDLQNTLITLKKNALILLARLTDNPDSFADNLMTSIFRLKLNNLAPFEKTDFVTSWSKECHVLLGMNFPKLF